MIIGRYLFKSLILATVSITVVLAFVIFLSQSLRFLELVINSGASGGAFWFLTALALPRFFEIILPIALMAAIVFTYNRLTMDNEIAVMRACGLSPRALARPALKLALAVTVLMYLVTMWIAPLSLSNMQHLRQVIKAQYSVLLFREGVFNAVVPGLTIFIRDRAADGELKGLMIHDSREDPEEPVTILAKKGSILVTPQGQQVLVFNGTRQSVNPESGMLNRLDFERYTIDLPDSAGPVRQRWREPEERMLTELLNPDTMSRRDVESRRDFQVEIHRRLASPLLAPAFAVLALAFLLLGPTDRRGQGLRIAIVAGLCVMIEGLYLAAFSLAQQHTAGLVMMYALVILPLCGGFLMLSAQGEKIVARGVPWRLGAAEGRS